MGPRQKIGGSTPFLVLFLALALGPIAACASGGSTGVPEPPVPRDAAEPRTEADGPAIGAEAGAALAQRSSAGTLLDTVRAGLYDNGKMWTFEYPPIDYLSDTYGFRPDSSWFRDARLSALRIPGCSASFVSPNGLVLTNHHCARESVSQVSGPDERLLDEGFMARSVDEERPVEDLYADQLVDIRDVTDRVYDELEGVAESERSAVRREVLAELESEILAEFGGEGGGHVVELISLYAGGRYSAYVFRRFEDVRLVMAPELQIGYYGGDPDNFTYPRYSLDFSFLRVYGDDDEPMESDPYFSWGSESGAGLEDLVFVIGNPGSTTRLQTVAQLQFRGDVSDRAVLDLLRTRIEELRAFLEEDPETAEELDLRNTIFSLENSEKLYEGRLQGLNDPVILARRLDQQQRFADSLAAEPELQAEYGGLIPRLSELMERQREHAAAYRAFTGLTSPDLSSATLQRALWAQQIVGARRSGVPEAQLTGVKERILGIADKPASLDQGMMEARFRDVVRAYGENSEMARNLLQGRTPEGLAAVILEGSALTDSASAAAALEPGGGTGGQGAGGGLAADPAVRAVGAYFPAFIQFQQMLSQVSPLVQETAAELGRARFEIYGTSVPPDATFSLRIADGVVRGYEYNGTRAPHHTTFYGLWDHYHSYAAEGADSPWRLPARWQQPPADLDLSVPVNFVSTNDIIGGNSGSPVINRDQEVVGLVFDGNIEGMPSDYIFLPEVSRTVSVDVRGIEEALDVVYDMDRILLELTRGELAETEEEADRILEGP